MKKSNVWKKIAILLIIVLGGTSKALAWRSGWTAIDGIEYKYYSYGEASVRGCAQDKLIVNIPSHITVPDRGTNYSYRVTCITSNVFFYYTNMISVTIGDCVEEIQWRAFQNCSKLTDLRIPDSVTNIGYQAFLDCNNLTSLTLGDNVKNIAGAAFRGCFGLRSLRIPDSVRNLEASAFEECWGLSSVSIGNNLTNIDEYTFYRCGGLKNMTIPDSVRRIGGQAFGQCSNLTSVSIGNSVEDIGASAFGLCESLTCVAIPNSVTNIGAYAFSGCTNLANVAIGNSVEKIEKGAFGGARLASVTIPDSVTSIEEYAFYGCTSLDTVFFQGGPPNVPGVSPYSPFSHVAQGARGYYTARHAAEWLPQISKDGKWRGLIMAELPAPVLEVAGANPVEGSLTLAWTDTPANATYSVYRSANDTYSATDFVTNGLTETTWTDTDYWAAEPVLKPLNYWVVADGGGYGERVSEPVETRRRYGLCVGYDDYGYDANGKRSTPHPQSLADARLCHLLAAKAEFEMNPVLSNNKASVDGIHTALLELAQKAKPGDTVLFYISTHGGISKSQDNAILRAYDGRYKVTQLVSDVAAFDSGVGFIGILMACHSKAMAGGSELSGWSANWLIENGLAMCTPNVAWITSCGANESSYNLEGSVQTMFGEWFLNQGWQLAHADEQLAGLNHWGVHGDGRINLLELAGYAQLFAKGESDKKPSRVNFENEGLLDKTIVATGVSSTGTGAPNAPATTTASQGVFDSKIEVSWSSASGALWYWVYLLKDGHSGDSEEDWECLSYGQQSRPFIHKAPWVSKGYQYRVRAVNGSGVSGPSPIGRGSRGTGAMLEWLQEKGKQLGLLGSAEELATMSSAHGMSLEGCYIADVDPTDPNASFQTELIREDGKWKAKPKGGEKEGRVYRVEGKKEMSDEDWTDVTDVEELEAEGWRFFRVGVELAE